jgi:hypothetical protein
MTDEIKEKELEGGNTSPTTSDLTTGEEKEFAPISAAQTRSRNSSLARVPTYLKSISRSRSNHGYGCDEHEESDESADVEGGVFREEKDPFEVKWQGGDNDEMNPRSLGLGRKWVVVLIVSASSLCV